MSYLVPAISNHPSQFPKGSDARHGESEKQRLSLAQGGVRSAAFDVREEVPVVGPPRRHPSRSSFKEAATVEHALGMPPPPRSMRRGGRRRRASVKGGGGVGRWAAAEASVAEQLQAGCRRRRASVEGGYCTRADGGVRVMLLWQRHRRLWGCRGCVC
jgi:hypothetical protein